MTELIAGMDAGKSVGKNLKDLNLLAIVVWVSQAWDKIMPISGLQC